jgi:hypothetical protein
MGGLGLASALVAGCQDRHQLQSSPSPDGGFVLLVDTINKPFGTQDVVVSLEEKRGLATVVAVFRNIQSFSSAWLGPEDIGVCQIGTVQSYKTHVVLNAHTGNQDFYVHYKCPLSLS